MNLIIYKRKNRKQAETVLGTFKVNNVTITDKNKNKIIVNIINKEEQLSIIKLLIDNSIPISVLNSNLSIILNKNMWQEIGYVFNDQTII